MRRVEPAQGVSTRPPQYVPVFTMADATMKRIIALLSRLLGNQRHEIGSAPFDREIEVAIVNEGVDVSGSPCLRHGDGWLDVETHRPIEVTATHWRYRRSVMPPMSCC